MITTGSATYFSKPDVVGPITYNYSNPAQFLDLSSFMVPCAPPSHWFCFRMLGQFERSQQQHREFHRAEFVHRPVQVRGNQRLEIGVHAQCAAQQPGKQFPVVAAEIFSAWICFSICASSPAVMRH